MSDIMPFPFTLEDAIRRARLNAGLTPAQVALELGIDVKSVHRWERGEKAPSGRHLAAFIRLTNASWLIAAVDALPRSEQPVRGLLSRPDEAA